MNSIFRRFLFIACIINSFCTGTEEATIETINLPVDCEVTHINNPGQMAGLCSQGVFIWDPIDGYYEIGAFDTGHHQILEFHDNGQLLVITHLLVQEAEKRKHGAMNWSPLTGLYTFVSENGDYATFDRMEDLFAYIGEDTPAVYETRAYLWDQGSIVEATTATKSD